MRKIFIIMTVAVGVALGAQAQQSAELAALQKQINELAAKITQLEKANAEKTAIIEKTAQIENANAEKIAQIEKVTAEKIAMVEQTAQIENANAEKIAQIEQDNAKKAWSLEQLQAEGKKNLAGAWANDIKLAGDFRYRYEKRDATKPDGSSNDKDRQRIRLRLGAYGTVNDFTDFGVRLASGDKKDGTSTNQSEDDNFSKKDVWLDQMYVDLHPELFGGAHMFFGKMPQPWITYNSGLIWDTDINPEGIAVTYEKEFLPFKLKANTGTFVMRENNNDEDIRLWSGQVAGEKKIGPGTFTLGVSDYYVDNADSVKSVTGPSINYNTPNGEFNMAEGFGSYGFTAFKLPVLINGQYVVNLDAATSEDTAYLAGITIGKAKEKGTWELGYSYRDIEKDAVVAGFNDSDFAGESWTGCHGHWFKARYQVFKNMSADLAYILATDYRDNAANTFQADLNFKF